MKNLGKSSHKIWTLRLTVLAVSLLFIPAFLYGAASVWVLLFGILLALLFDARLQATIDKTENTRPGRKRSLAAIGHYFLLMLEMLFISSAGPIVFLYSGWGEDAIVGSLDAVLLNYAPLGFLKEGNYASDPVNFQILLAATAAIFVAFIGVAFVSFKKMTMLARRVIHLQTQNGRLIYRTLGGGCL